MKQIPSHTDISENGLFFRALPPFLIPYLLLARLDRPVGIWLLLLPGWWAIALAAGGITALNAHDIQMLFLFAVGAVVMRSAGCVINDLWDRRIDAQVARTKKRPLASGAITVNQALAFLALLLFAGFIILLRTDSLVTVLLGFMALPLVVLYPLMKRLTWWPQLFLGLIFNFGALMGWAAVTMSVQIPTLLLYAGGIFWTLGYDTIYAHQDREDDLRLGVKSTAIRLGGFSKVAIAVFYALSWILIFLAFRSTGAGLTSMLLLFPAAAHHVWQIRTWDMNDPQSCLRTFRASRDFGLLVLLAALL